MESLLPQENMKHVLMDLHETQRKAVILEGHAGRIPRGTNTDVMDRLSPMSADWHGVTHNFTSFRCKIRARYMGSNRWSDNPLLVLEVKPLEEIPTTKPPNSQTPWHITVGFYDSYKAQEFRNIVEKYLDWTEYTLIGWVQGASFYLDTERCPVGSDQDLLALIRSDPYYGHKPIHMSF